jgi:hypothetical protein
LTGQWDRPHLNLLRPALGVKGRAGVLQVVVQHAGLVGAEGVGQMMQRLRAGHTVVGVGETVPQVRRPSGESSQGLARRGPEPACSCPAAGCAGSEGFEARPAACLDGHAHELVLTLLQLLRRRLEPVLHDVPQVL